MRSSTYRFHGILAHAGLSLATLCCATALTVPVWLPSPAVAAEQPVRSGGAIEAIVVEGNQRIESMTIRSYLTVSEGNRFSVDALENSLQRLFATGLFADVSLLRRENTLVVQVKENPVINSISFQGNDKVESDTLENEILLKPRMVYTKLRLQNDVKKLLDIYRKTGRYSAEVVPKVETLDQNRLNLVFEIKEGEVAKVKSINFIGNHTFDKDKLLEVIKTQEERWYRFFSDDNYDPDRFLYDQQLLRRFYVNKGYADFKITSATAELDNSGNQFYLTFSVDEGKPYTFGKVTIESSLADLSTDELSTYLTTLSGESFDAQAIENSIDQIIKAIGELGYAFVDVTPQIDRNEASQTIDLTYRLEEGPRVYIEAINIRGNVRTIDPVIRREFRLSEGDPYRTSAVQRSEQRVRNLGFFDKVDVTRQPGSAPDKTILNVDVQERSTGELSFGAGFSSVDGPLADVSIKESNLLGKGQDLRLRLLMAAERQEVDLSFTEPYFLNRDIAAGFDLFSFRQDFRSESSFDREANGGKLRATYTLSEYLRHSLNYTLREDKISNVDATASRFVREQEGTRLLSSVGHELTYDKRDNRYDPSGGYYFSLSQDAAGLGGDVSFLRNEASYSHYFPVYKEQDWVLKLGGSLGYIFGLGSDDVNINDRFFIGGRSLRGFESAGIGARDITTQDALGGNTYYTLSSELQFPFSRSEDGMGFLGSIFIDAGSLWDIDSTGPEIVDSSSLRAAAGFGLAWRTPLGPIRLDFARAFVKEDFDKTQFFRLNFGTRF